MGYRLEELFQITVNSINNFEGVSEERMAEIVERVTSPDAFKTYEEAKLFGAEMLHDFEELDYFTVNKTFSLYE